MAATNFTPISLYYSTTAAAVPINTNLVNGELAINITDGKLFYKDNSGVVQVIGTKGGVGTSSTTQVLYNSSGAVVGSANLTFDGTTLTAAGLAGPHNGTVGATTPNTGVFTTAKAIAASTQDSVILQGRAGGTSSYGVTLTPTTLTASRTLTLPDASGTILQSGTAVTVGQGGTGITSGTSGGIPYFSSTSAISSSAALAANTMVVGGGAGATPLTVSNITSDNTYLQLGATTPLRFGNTGNTFYVALKGPAGTAANVTWTLPSVDGTSGQVLSTNGSGTLSWATATTTPANPTSSVQFNNAGSFGGSANMTFDGTTLTAAGFSGPHNGTVGATTASTGAFTTLSASSTVSGTGFSTYLASPPAIGGTAPAAGTFTTAKAIAAATQDAVQLQGRAGGTSSYVATITPTTLTASRTFTLPDAAGTLLLDGGALGTPSSGTVTNLTGTASININGTVGATTANTGAFTTLSASSTVSGTGFSTYLASPPAIGGTAAAAGTFTTGTFNTSTVHKGATSGTVTISAPAVAGTQSYTLPTAVPAANGYALTSTTGGTMSWSAITASAGGSTTQVQYNNGGSLAGISGFTSDGTRVTASTTIGVGGATPSTSGSGITFPATSSVSSNANTLDDYEVGTWTPTLGGTATYVAQVGTYIKIGRLVYITCLLETILRGTGSTTTISGLPFTTYTGPLIDFPLSIRSWSGLATNVLYIVPVAKYNLSTIEFNNTSTAGTATGALTVAIFGNSTKVDIAGCYYTIL
jgi:hypothetical protein